MWLACLIFLIGDHLHIHILLGVGLSFTHFFLRVVDLGFDLPLLKGFNNLEAEV
jgi:hypothetical protein